MFSVHMIMRKRSNCYLQSDVDFGLEMGTLLLHVEKQPKHAIAYRYKASLID